MPRDGKFHPILGLAAPDRDYFRIILVAAGIGIVAGATTTSSLLEGSPKSSGYTGRLENSAHINVTDHTRLDVSTPGGLAKAGTTNFKSVPLQNISPETAIESQRNPNSHEERSPNKQSVSQTIIDVQTTADTQHCNISVCEQRYQSFRLSDCTYQPYSGPRRYCTK